MELTFHKNFGKILRSILFFLIIFKSTDSLKKVPVKTLPDLFLSNVWTKKKMERF